MFVITSFSAASACPICSFRALPFQERPFRPALQLRANVRHSPLTYPPCFQKPEPAVAAVALVLSLFALVPLSVAIGRLLATKPDTQLIAPGSLKEGAEEATQNEQYLFTLNETSASFMEVHSKTTVQTEAIPITSPSRFTTIP